MKKLLNKKMIIIFIVALISVLLIASFLLYYFLIRKVVTFKLVGKENVTVNIYEPYTDLGYIAKVNDEDLSSEVVVDSSNLDINKLGTYEVTYKLKYKEKEYSLVRKVNVVDSIAPTLTLIGEEEVIIDVGSVYQEQGCNVVDNYDSEVKNKINIINRVNTNVEGVYDVVYTVVDNHKNKSEITRKVIVKPKDKELTEDNYLDLMESNLITDISFIEDGIYVQGYVKDNNGTFKIKLCENNKRNCISYNMKKQSKYYYDGNIRISNLENGTYYMWINSKIDEKVVNKLDMQYRVVRSKIGDKLITFSYENDNVKLTVEDFNYKYDILIDPGHGGSDPGAGNNITNEKTFNLVQSLYEKERYEEHGLKVLMLRSDESYGIVMGDSSWPAVRKKAYALGYYGVVSKITYSNHHNSSEDKSMSGWEIIVSANASKNDLVNIYKIKDNWNKSYNVLENHIRLYTRNYNTGTIFTKENEEEYYFTDYYAVIRLPYQLFNIKNVLFEGSYLSNMDDFNWYYNNDSWKKLSEEKIKVYVESLGVKYIAP